MGAPRIGARTSLALETRTPPRAPPGDRSECSEPGRFHEPIAPVAGEGLILIDLEVRRVLALGARNVLPQGLEVIHQLLSEWCVEICFQCHVSVQIEVVQVAPRKVGRTQHCPEGVPPAHYRELGVELFAMSSIPAALN